MLEHSLRHAAARAAVIAAVLVLASIAGVAAALAAVLTSQLGFAPGDPQTAVLAVAAGTVVEPAFEIVDATTGAVVYRGGAGDVTAYPGGWTGSNARGDTYRLDFSAAELPVGRYVVQSNGERSVPFRVDPSIHDVRLLRPLEFFRLQRSGVAVTWQALDGATGGHGPDHLDDARQATRKDRGGGDRPLIEQDLVVLPNGRLDVSGGWFDAGDYNEYMGNTPWAAYVLLRAFEEYGAYWSAVDADGNGSPDLLDQVRPALDWMLAMRHTDGSVYERVFNGFTAAFDGRPDLETDNRPGTGDDRPLDTDRYADITVKASYAMAAAYRVFGDARYLDMAVRAWDWALANQTRVKPQVYEAGNYFGEVEVGLTLGAIELYRTTGEARYRDYATAHVRAHLDAADWVYPSSWDYQNSWVLQRYADLASPEDQARIVTQLRAYWDAAVGRQDGNPYRVDDQWMYGAFGQNEKSISAAGDAVWLFSRTGDRRYYDYAVNQLAWVFGRNPFAESWVASAWVSEYTRVPHWRVTARHPIEGVVVPGAADTDGDGIPDYADRGDWYYSEPTINQQAMFVHTMSALHAASRGSGTVGDARPHVSLTAPTELATVTGSVAVRAQASDDRAVATASYRIDTGQMGDMALVAGDARSGAWEAALDTTRLAEGRHLVVVTVVDSAGQSETSLPVAIQVRNVVATLHIQDIVLQLVGKKGTTKIQARGDVFVVDAAGRPVAGATVRGHWEGAARDAFTAPTDAAGKVTDYSDVVPRTTGSTFTLVVDGVTAPGFVRDPAADRETRESITVP